MSKTEIREVIIVGSGPAGLTAAVYAARANLSPLMIEGAEAGGQLMITTDVDNFPGFEKGVQGPDLIMNMKAQAKRFETEFVQQDVTDIDLSARPFKVSIDDEVYFAKTIIISTGAKAKLLGLPAESKLMGSGVSACATCDGFFFREKEVFVVGGGDTAAEEAIFLTRFAKKVTIIHRRDTLRASKILQDKARENPKIDFIWDTTVTDITADDSGRMNGLVLKNLKTEEVTTPSAAGLFIAIGHSPNTSLFAGQLELDDAGYIVTQAKSTLTSVPGVFAAGDVQDTTYRQAITAAGTGCMAAIDAEHFLEEGGA